ncbi:MAG: hypothetical protein P4M02_09735 [Clostridia bacterium]|nr:hypothetical protein [Clostridia bacterium]
MIYIKDYQALNELVTENERHGLFCRSLLPSLIGRTITVFVDSGGASGAGFTGILIETFSDSIRLLTAVESAPAVRMNCPRKKRNCCRCGSCTTIMLEHITAITYNNI